MEKQESFMLCALHGHPMPCLLFHATRKQLHSGDVHITFVITEFSHTGNKGPDALNGMPDLRYKTTTDGLPPLKPDTMQHSPLPCEVPAVNNLIADGLYGVSALPTAFKERDSAVGRYFFWRACLTDENALPVAVLMCQ
ncbi:hypothetical protein Nepgr_026544 [Nepenthes gracilis]|uniref:Uncharacterized protein n=1 Tax=Nepenthes gracilis TaxID=150966 RepID=A0AAD3T8R4_NEPGR|nr:hypothetical protein Nepgr_026544 [Nepenthes gracilis]